MSHENQNAHNHSAKGYIVGFILSIVLTFLAFYIVKAGFSVGVIFFVVFSAAVVQLFIQLWFFLHLNEEKSPYYMSQALFFGIFTVFIFVAGSLWVMYQLSYHMHL